MIRSQLESDIGTWKIQTHKSPQQWPHLFTQTWIMEETLQTIVYEQTTFKEQAHWKTLIYKKFCLTEITKSNNFDLSKAEEWTLLFINRSSTVSLSIQSKTSYMSIPQLYSQTNKYTLTTRPSLLELLLKREARSTPQQIQLDFSKTHWREKSRTNSQFLSTSQETTTIQPVSCQSIEHQCKTN